MSCPRMTGTRCVDRVSRIGQAWKTVAGVAAVLAAAPAHAHAATGLQGGFIAGFLHPLTGPDHLLAMVAVGLWGAILGRPLLYALPVVFPMVMAAAGVAAIAGLMLPAVELGIALSVAVLGAAIALNWSPPPWLAIAVVAWFALFHGWAHGAELPSMADPVDYSTGFVTATGLLHLSGIAIGTIDHWPGGRLILRVLGGLVLVCGLWFAAQAWA